MLTITSKGLRESLARAKEANPELFEQPRGLSIPVPPPPADLPSTPGVADSAERATQRAGLVVQVRRQQEELPVVVARQAFRGAIAGSLSGLAILLIKNLCSPKRSPIGNREYSDGDIHGDGGAVEDHGCLEGPEGHTRYGGNYDE
jgi:hypothetical protein